MSLLPAKMLRTALGLLPVFFVACKAPTPMLSLKTLTQDIRIYRKSFSGIRYLQLRTKGRPYSVVCELKKRMSVFIWYDLLKTRGYLDSCTAVIDTARGFGRCFGLENPLALPASDTAYFPADPLELELLTLAAGVATNGKYPYDLKKVVFFAKWPISWPSRTN